VRIEVTNTPSRSTDMPSLQVHLTNGPGAGAKVTAAGLQTLAGVVAHELPWQLKVDRASTNQQHPTKPWIKGKAYAGSGYIWLDRTTPADLAVCLKIEGYRPKGRGWAKKLGGAVVLAILEHLGLQWRTQCANNAPGTHPSAEVSADPAAQTDGWQGLRCVGMPSVGDCMRVSNAQGMTLFTGSTRQAANWANALENAGHAGRAAAVRRVCEITVREGS